MNILTLKKKIRDLPDNMEVVIDRDPDGLSMDVHAVRGVGAVVSVLQTFTTGSGPEKSESRNVFLLGASPSLKYRIVD